MPEIPGCVELCPNCGILQPCKIIAEDKDHIELDCMVCGCDFEIDYYPEDNKRKKKK